MMECTHLDQINVTETDTDVCKDCVKQGDNWVQLRMCLTCGYVGCCDSSKNKHARRHYEQTGHLLIRSVESDDNWRYCYEDQLYLNAQNEAVREG